MLIIIIGRLISIPCDIVRKKQNIEKKKRNEVYTKIEKEANGDKSKITDEIYNYYKESNFKPWKLIFTNIVIFLVDLIILTSILACFKPLTNFSDIPKEDVKQMVSIYNESSEIKKYPEISMLYNINETTSILKNNNIADKYINEIITVKENFMLGNLDTTTVPKMSSEPNIKILPIIVLSLCVLQNLIPIINILKKKNKNRKLLIINLSVMIFVLSITMTIIMSTPVIVCFYLMIIYLYGIGRKIISILKENKGETNSEKTNKKNSKENCSDTI